MLDTSEIGFKFVQDLALQLSGGNLELPAFPDVAIRIQKVLNDPNVDAGKVARAVSSDPVISARLLKVANSAANRGVVNIGDIPTAVTRLGFKMAHNTAVSIAVEQLMQAESEDALKPRLKKLWTHSLQVAAISFVLAKKQTNINPDEAMLAGLVHDIGKFYILTRMKNYPDLFGQPDAMDEVMRDWHTGVGRAILESWRFSEELATAVDEHEMLERSVLGQADLTDVVLVANLCAHSNKHLREDLDWNTVTAVSRLRLDKEGLNQVMSESEEEIQSIVQALSG